MISEITTPKISNRNKLSGMTTAINFFGCDSYHLFFKGKIIQKKMGPKKIKKNPILIAPLVKKNDSPPNPRAMPSNILPAIQSASPTKKVIKPLQMFFTLITFLSIRHVS